MLLSLCFQGFFLSRGWVLVERLVAPRGIFGFFFKGARVLEWLLQIAGGLDLQITSGLGISVLISEITFSFVGLCVLLVTAFTPHCEIRVVIIRHVLLAAEELPQIEPASMSVSMPVHALVLEALVASLRHARSRTLSQQCLFRTREHPRALSIIYRV